MTKLDGVKIAIMQVTYFLNGPIFNLLFCCHIILYWKKLTSYESFSHNLTFEVQIVWKISAFQYYWWKYQNIKKIPEFLKISIDMKNRKTFYKAQTARENFSLSSQPTHHQIKSYYVFETKFFLGRYTEICRHFLSNSLKKVVLWRQEMVQCKIFFWPQTETCLLENL